MKVLALAALITATMAANDVNSSVEPVHLARSFGPDDASAPLPPPKTEAEKAWEAFTGLEHDPLAWRSGWLPLSSNPTTGSSNTATVTGRRLQTDGSISCAGVRDGSVPQSEVCVGSGTGGCNTADGFPAWNGMCGCCCNGGCHAGSGYDFCDSYAGRTDLGYGSSIPSAEDLAGALDLQRAGGCDAGDGSGGGTTWVLEDCPGPSCMNTGGRGSRLMIGSVSDCQAACEAVSHCDAIEHWAGNSWCFPLVTGVWEPVRDYPHTSDGGYPANIYTQSSSVGGGTPHIEGLAPTALTSGQPAGAGQLLAAADTHCNAHFSGTTACTREQFEGADNFEDHNNDYYIQLRQHNSVFSTSILWFCYPAEDVICNGHRFACCSGSSCAAPDGMIGYEYMTGLSGQPDGDPYGYPSGGWQHTNMAAAGYSNSPAGCRQMCDDNVLGFSSGTEFSQVRS